MKKITLKNIAGVLLAGGMIISAVATSGLGVSNAAAAGKTGGKVAIKPYIQYTFDTADTMLTNTGTSASDATKNYNLSLKGNATAVNMCYMGDVEFKDNAALYLENDNNPFANGDLTDFTVALDVSLRYSSWYGAPVSWDGVVGDADAGSYSDHKYMRVTSAGYASDADWLRFIDNQTWSDEKGGSIANKAHWEAWGRGSKFYQGDRTVNETSMLTLIISVDKDSKLTAKSYLGVYEQETLTQSLEGKNWELYSNEADAVNRFTLGAAYDSRSSEKNMSSKLNGRMDNVRIYDFAMSEEEMASYATSDDKQLYVDGVEIDKEIVGGTVTVDKTRPEIGEEVTITPVADANAELKEITVNGEAIEAVDGVYKATMVNGGLFVSAKFIRSFAVTMDSAMTNGTVVADKNVVKEGETVTLNVTPNSGYQVKSVFMNGATVEPVDGAYSFVMPSEDVTVSAEFGKWLNVSVKAGITGGTVSVNKTECWENDSVIITAKPEAGYEIRKVLVNGVEIQKSGIVYKFTATEDAEVDVQFAVIGSSDSEGGCGSSIMAGGLSVVTLLGASAVALFRKKRK